MGTTSKSETQHWLYPVNSKAGFVLHVGDNPNDESNQVTRQNIWDDIDKNIEGVDAWVLHHGFRLMQPDDLVWIVDTQPPKGIIAVGRAASVYKDEFEWYVDLVWDVKATKALKRQFIPKEAYGQTAQSVNRAKPETIKVLAQWLKTHSTTPRPGQSGIVILSQEDTRTRALRDMAIRRGQGAFRNDLLDSYGRACAITGSTAEEVLEAAHIQPYRGEHTNDIRNGILLRSDIHTLFDLHLIKVDRQNIVCVSSRLQGTEYWQYNGTSLRVPPFAILRPGRNLLNAHAKQFIA